MLIKRCTSHRLPSSIKKLLLATLLAAAGITQAGAVTITTNQIISTPTTYKNVTLDMSAGFIIVPGGSLDIENCIINVSASPTNPFFTYMTTGGLILKDNTVKVSVSGITPNSSVQALFQLIKVDQGSLAITHNNFSVDQAYSLGFFTTNKTFATSGFSIRENVIKNFHGGIYLLNSYADEVENNTFTRVSLSNILNTGDSSEFEHNIFNFPGNLAQGNAFDIINSTGIEISNNIIASSSNYGIHIMGGKDITISRNKITDSLSYGINIEAATPVTLKKHSDLIQAGITVDEPSVHNNRHIIVSKNYLSQNRYGLSAQSVNGLSVNGNTFIQKFQDAVARKFWTSNDHLLSDVSGLTWTANLYKEAFTQVVPGDNTLAKQFVVFPETGGVTL